MRQFAFSRREVVGGVAALVPAVLLPPSLGRAAGVPVHLRSDPAQRVFHVRDYGARGDADTITGGGTDDTAAIQAAVDAAYRAKGGLVVFEPGATYKLGPSSAVGPNIMGAPSIMLRPGVSFDGQGCHLYQTAKATIIGLQERFHRFAQVIEDVARDDRSVTVDYPEIFTPGQSVFLRIGENGFQPIEPRYTLIAKVASVRGRRVVLDRPIAAPVVIDETTQENCRLHVMAQPIEGIAVRNFHFHSPPDTSPECGLLLVAARDIRVENLWAHGNIGAGLLNFQFVEDIRCRDIIVLRNANPTNHSAMGRAVTLSNARDCVIERLVARELSSTAVFIESHSTGIRLRHVDIVYTSAKAWGPPVFFAAEDSEVVYENVYLRTMEPAIVHDSGGSPVRYYFNNLTFSSPVFPIVMPPAHRLAGILRMQIAGKEFAYDLRRVQISRKTVPLPSSRTIVVDDLPAGLLVRYETRLSADLPESVLSEAWIKSAGGVGDNFVGNIQPNRRRMTVPEQGIGTHNNSYASTEMLVQPRQLLLVTAAYDAGEISKPPELSIWLHIAPRI